MGTLPYENECDCSPVEWGAPCPFLEAWARANANVTALTWRTVGCHKVNGVFIYLHIQFGPSLLSCIDVEMEGWQRECCSTVEYFCSVIIFSGYILAVIWLEGPSVLHFAAGRTWEMLRVCWTLVTADVLMWNCVVNAHWLSFIDLFTINRVFDCKLNIK